MNKIEIYNRLPVSLQNLACSVEGFKIERHRYGSRFWEYLRKYEELGEMSYDGRCAYRDARLASMVRHAYATVPHWRRVFDETGLDPESIRTIDDLRSLPLLTKSELQANPTEFMSTSISKKELVTQHTSGTTGTGLVFKTTRDALAAQWAVWWRYRRKLGIEYGTRCAVFGGRTIVPPNSKSRPYYRSNVPAHQYLFSQYHLGDGTANEYLCELNGLHVKWLHGYPSVISLLASKLVETGEQLSIKHITLGAENLLDQQRELMTKAFGVEPRQHYGLSEAVANFSQREDGRMFVDEEFAAVELVSNEWGSHEVVGTTLTNYAMPLIRYRTNDVAEFCERPDGREVLSLDGRSEDYVVLADGRRVGRLDHLFKDMVNVREAQIVQSEPGNFTVRLVPTDTFGEHDLELLDGEIRSRMGDVEYAVEAVDSIERTSSGKLRFVVSTLGKGGI